MKNYLFFIFIILCYFSFVSSYDDWKTICIQNNKPLHVSILSAPQRSHVNTFIGLGQYLSSLGCKVTFPIFESKLDWISYKGIEPISIPLSSNKSADISIESRSAIIYAFSSSQFKIKFFTYLFKYYIGYYSDSPIAQVVDFQKDMVSYLLSKYNINEYNPDLIISEISYPLFYDLAEIMDVPVVGVCPSLMSKYWENVQHFIPSYGSGFPLDMNIFQRVINYYIMPLLKDLCNYFVGQIINNARKELDILDKVKDISLLMKDPGVELFQSCWGIEYPHYYLPTKHLVGPLFPLESKKLSEELESWIVKDNKDIIYIAMGTVAVITKDIATEFVNAIKDEEYRVIWSLPENQRNSLDSLDLPDNLLLQTFVPQRELLLYKQIKVFLSHAGASSSREALTSGTPVLCMPYFGDQHEFCTRMVNAGMALQLDKDNLNSLDIKNNIRYLLTNTNVITNAKKMEQIMKCGGNEVASEIILKTYLNGYEHLLPYSVNLPWYKKDALDIKIITIITFMILGILIFKIISLCFQNKKYKQE